MNPNVKLWLDALRSGKYKQTQRKLATTEGYCCLGVACEVAIEAGVRVVKSPPDEDGIITYNKERVTPPWAVAEWLGLRTYTGFSEDLPRINNQCELTAYNDTGVPFEQIADIIEENYTLLFNK